MIRNPPSWCSTLLQKAFVLGANGPDNYDCWGIVRAGLAIRWGVDLPELNTLRGQDAEVQMAVALEECDGCWTPVDPKDVISGDVLEFVGKDGGIHVGLVLDEVWMMHIRPNSFSCVERYRRPPWLGLVTGAHRHREVAQ